MNVRLSPFARSVLSHRWLVVCFTFVGLLPTGIAAYATEVSVTNLVTDDQTAHPAQISDPDLKNAWGISSGPSTPFWVSDNGVGKTTLYSVNPTSNLTAKVNLTVTLPGLGPTGQVFNGNASSFNGNAFLFVNEDGTVSGWRGALGTNAERLQLATPDNVYKGAAIAMIGGTSYLYAANFRTGRVDVLKGAASAPDLVGSFTAPALPAGYAPFNVQNIGDALYVSYAQQGAASGLDEVDGAGFGFVSKFDLQGQFQQRIASAGTLNAPWGMALAPESFGALAGDLLVGNFGDGTITVIDLKTGNVIGKLQGTDGKPVQIDGLWALKAGNGGRGGSLDKIYFTAGPDDETHGLFGVLTAVPEPETYAMFGIGLLALFGFRRRS